MKKYVTALFLALVMNVAAIVHADHHINHEHSSKQSSAQPTIKLSILPIEDKDQGKHVKMKLSKLEDESPVPPELLKEMHTEKVHLLIIDDSLTDYSHIHPKPTKEPGVYEFDWAPTKKDANYRMWADLHPLDTDQQEYAIADLTASQTKGTIDKTPSSESTLDGLTFKLSFENPELQAGKATMGKVTITDDKGKPVTNLEPLMGAFAHIVGFSYDFQSIVHIHPMGKEPTNPSDRGGPDLQFHIEPEKAGFLKLFVQVKINGKEIFAPFGLVVKGAEN